MAQTDAIVDSASKKHRNQKNPYHDTILLAGDFVMLSAEFKTLS